MVAVVAQGDVADRSSRGADGRPAPRTPAATFMPKGPPLGDRPPTAPTDT